MSESTPNAEDLSLLKRQIARLEARLVEERESTLRLWTGVCLFLTALAFIVPLQTFEEGSVYLVTAPLEFIATGTGPNRGLAMFAALIFGVALVAIVVGSIGWFVGARRAAGPRLTGTLKTFMWLYLLAAAGLFLVWFAVLSHFGSSMQFSPAILMLGTGAFAMLLASFHARRLD